MKKLNEIGPNQPDYDSKAMNYSKMTIGYFLISFIYLLISTGIQRSDWLGFVLLIVFPIVGIFVSSIAIAMPFFIMSRMFPRFTLFVTIASIITTFYVTKIAYHFVFVKPKLETNFVSPAKFSQDKVMFKDSIIKYGEASDITNDSGRKATKEETSKVLELTLITIEDSKKVGDEFLDYLHPDLKKNYRDKLIKSLQLYYDGLVGSKDGDTLESESVKKQIESVTLMSEWSRWWESNGQEIADKLFSEKN